MSCNRATSATTCSARPCSLATDTCHLLLLNKNMPDLFSTGQQSRPSRQWRSWRTRRYLPSAHPRCPGIGVRRRAVSQDRRPGQVYTGPVRVQPRAAPDDSITLSDEEDQGERSQIRRSEWPGLSRRSPGEPRRSRLSCSPTPGLGVDRRRQAWAQSGLTAARLEPSVKDRCCGGPFRRALQNRALQKGPPDVCRVSRIGHLCGNLHRQVLRDRQPAVPPPGPKCGSAH